MTVMVVKMQVTNARSREVLNHCAVFLGCVNKASSKWTRDCLLCMLHMRRGYTCNISQSRDAVGSTVIANAMQLIDKAHKFIIL